ncbi:nuclear transport factor 2 family protein [Catellatospora sp. KI3]|uniref:nuclear transport factor 2 family protein n=1 Tax=Catellatospora sp. KI3 TaxID=3041620 RepID=UPI0024825A6A|nr:nuclear transport factor 2 family protein [Catellatospora sp. KI3]MDI1463869.1 nuclear transport factor 2 family protein [Catellatospora sp. KI3]
MALTAFNQTLDTAPLYLAVQQFYARHMQLLDEGDPDQWAATFTEDGSFHAPGLPQPVRGRAVLAQAVRDTRAKLAEQGELRRHWHGMVKVAPAADGSLDVRCYAIVIQVAADGTPRLHRHCVCQDNLVPSVDSPDGWLVRSRQVTLDPLPAA